jgi:hypothetical protein
MRFGRDVGHDTHGGWFRFNLYQRAHETGSSLRCLPPTHAYTQAQSANFPTLPQTLMDQALEFQRRLTTLSAAI